VFGVLFAVNSSLHSYMIVSYAQEMVSRWMSVSTYMANAIGRLIGTFAVRAGFSRSGGLNSLPLGVSFSLLPWQRSFSVRLPRHEDISVKGPVGGANSGNTGLGASAV